MSLQEALFTGLQTTVIGLVIVFSVLFILMLILKIFEKVFYKKPEENVTSSSEVVKENVVSEVLDDNKVDEDELIAVFSAAIAASLNTSTYNLKIKSYRRINNNVPAWNKAGIRETIENRM